MTDEELETGRAALTRGYPRNFETADQIGRAAAQLALYQLPDDYFTTFVPKVLALTAADIMRVAAADIDPSRLLTVIIGDREKVSPSAATLDLGARVRGHDDVKAVRFHEHGGPEVLRYEDAPDPVASDGRALVRVRACALNHLDLWERRGIGAVTLPLPHISGSDVSGEVLDAGSGPIAPGTRVLLQPGLRCGACPACRAGRDNQCADLRRPRAEVRRRLRRARRGARREPDSDS